MTLQRRLIEYYFYHYHDYCFYCIAHQESFGSATIPYVKSREATHCKVVLKKPDALAFSMADVVERTYYTFAGKKREIIRMKFFRRLPRASIIVRLNISERTYHRYLQEIMEYAEGYFATLKIPKPHMAEFSPFWEECESLSHAYTPASLNDYSGLDGAI